MAFRSLALRQPSEALALDEPPAVPLTLPVLKVLIAVPTLQSGAADAGAVDLVRIIAGAGHRPIVVSAGGQLEPEIVRGGAEFIRADLTSRNPITLMRNGLLLRRLVREHGCDVVHALGRGPAWSAYLAARSTGAAFVTSCYKGFREQNVFKRFYNGVMARGDRVVAAGEQIAELINERYGTPLQRIVVAPPSVDCRAFDPALVSRERMLAARRSWGAGRETRIILVPGRMTARKGHHVVVQAVRRLKDIGIKDFMCVFASEDQGRSRYAGELWDLVLATGTADAVRLVGPYADRAAAYAAATVVVSAAIQPEGVQRALLEAQAMRCPVIASALGAGADVVLAPPGVAEERATGLRVAAGDDAALAAAVIRLFTMPEAQRQAIGTRGRAWMLDHFDDARLVGTILRLYRDLAAKPKCP